MGRASGGIIKNGNGGAHADKNKLLPFSLPPPLVRIVLGLQPIFVQFWGYFGQFIFSLLGGYACRSIKNKCVYMKVCLGLIAGVSLRLSI